MAGLHHVELWVSDQSSAREDWAWLLARVGFERTDQWDRGESWHADGAYVTVTTSPNLSHDVHDRRRPGVNHLAFEVPTADDVDAIMAEAPSHGWSPLYDDRYPHAGGPDHYAGWLENDDEFKAEVVAAHRP